MEIKHAMGSIPILAASLAPVFLLEVRGYSRLYIEFDNTTIGKSPMGPIKFYCQIPGLDSNLSWIERVKSPFCRSWKIKIPCTNEV